MKFKSGDATDSAHCTALAHEFLRCEDAFRDFETYGTATILDAQAQSLGQSSASPDQKRLMAYKTYNAYSRFIHHLYEFSIGTVQRDRHDTTKIEAADAEGHIKANLQRILTRTRKAIQDGSAPAWENQLSYYPEKAPQDFAKEFRQFRNAISGHVTHKRSSLSLSEFYERNHKYLYMIYRDGLSHWGLRGGAIPDLKEITEFSVLIKQFGVTP
jgi:hypothetical protein